MHKLFKELRRREVFRTAGLYVGIAWIVVEASSVLFDAFEAPDWALQAVIIIAIIGLPVTIVLAWIFDITDHGIEVQAEATDTQVIPFGGRRTDFAVIGVLSVALIFSVYLNIAGKVDAVDVPLEPLSILIADFDNQTGDPLFNGTLEQAVLIGIEGASFITSYSRAEALATAQRLELGEILDNELAQLMAVRQDIDLVLRGIVETEGSGFRIGVTAITAEAGEPVSEVSGVAKSKADVLALVGELTKEIREELGDESIATSGDATSETFTAASLEAAKFYTTAIDLAFAGDHEKAMELYQQAIEEDPNFGRAYSGWALSAFKLGRQEEAEKLWDQALSLMNTMTERERYRTLGLYYSVVTRNYEKAVESFSSLVEKYPADAAGHNNLAVASFLSLDFETAMREGKAILDIYSESPMYRSNYALYAMYSSNFDVAEQEARNVVSNAPEYGSAYLALAIAAIEKGELDAAREAYRQMVAADKSEHGDSLATLGLGDIEIYAGSFETAYQILNAGIDVDLANENAGAAATKHLAIAQGLLASGDKDGAARAADTALELAGGDTRLVPAALIYLGSGHSELAAPIAEEMQQQLQPHTRAYGMMLQGILHRINGEHVKSLDALRSALQLADLWLIRYQLGRSYLAAEQYAEALDEFTIAESRRGEASALFLDDMPTYRVLAELPYWTGRAQEGLNMSAAALESYQAFLDRWSDTGPLASDARKRLQ
jgi:tetratricopeptide (TPR) repeat protein